ncbi:hypothetical protein B0A48_01306 [Cryoendolithus antarcticus]|uniref:Uncharacterized protein n=1 Tax=Cryoendolithus antarcticus TaxID=1507870 RepID=A0A1V8TSV2_9PEZI|nr:hypothetical protein B0A48_01306 [Cryoendolithus antarcticus]
MLVPRSYKYSSSPPREVLENEKTGGFGFRKANRGIKAKNEHTRPEPVRTTTVARSVPAEAERVPSRPMNVPVADARAVSGRSASSGHVLRTDAPRPVVDGRRSQSDSLSPQAYKRRTAGGMSRPTPRSGPPHRADALSPSVAALLAMTAIPPPKPHQVRRRRTDRKMSIDELVHSWKSDVSLGPVYSSSPSLSVLLESAHDIDADSTPSATPQTVSRSYPHLRSTSSESMPSLERDDRSVRSGGSPSTPGSLRSRRSLQNLRKELVRSLPSREDCALDHPLATPECTPDEAEEEDYLFLPTTRPALPPKPKTSFKSNLTSSLQALKAAAISSIGSLTASSASDYAPRRNSMLPDDLLWSHPFLFPRLSSEIRPEIRGTPTEAQRRYLNPHPLTFEEQETPFQLALHAPFLRESHNSAPGIQLQSYSSGSRGRRKASVSSKGVGSGDEAAFTEAGRGVRQREPRENSDFLRVVVLEMNMRREGKLEAGKAKIWLPPRKDGGVEDETGSVKGVPRRWIGVSA